MSVKNLSFSLSVSSLYASMSFFCHPPFFCPFSSSFISFVLLLLLSFCLSFLLFLSVSLFYLFLCLCLPSTLFCVSVYFVSLCVCVCVCGCGCGCVCVCVCFVDSNLFNIWRSGSSKQFWFQIFYVTRHMAYLEQEILCYRKGAQYLEEMNLLTYGAKLTIRKGLMTRGIL